MEILRCSFFVIKVSLVSSTLLVLGGNDETRMHSLLAFKAQIVDDSLGILSFWNGSKHFCECIPAQEGHGVGPTVFAAKGLLSPHVGNLSFLRTLNLQTNSFSHNIPQEIGRLSRLRSLHLANNSLSGQIPVNISRCSGLRLWSLAGNNLTGKLPNNIGSLAKLQVLDFHSNFLVGEVPTSYGNLSSLVTFLWKKIVCMEIYQTP